MSFESVKFAPINLGRVSVQFVRVYFSAANVDVPVPHDLRVVPIGWSVARIDTHAIIKDSQMPPAPNAIYLVSNTAGVTATIRVEAVNFSER
jgi:hypothetical protein